MNRLLTSHTWQFLILCNSTLHLPQKTADSKLYVQKNKPLRVQCWSNVFLFFKDGQVNRYQYISGTAEHHFGELNATRLAFICIYPLKGSFQSHEEPTFKDSDPLHEGTFLRSHRCWMNWNVQVEQALKDRPVGPFSQPSLPWLSSPRTPWPEPTPPSWAVTRCAAGLWRMNRHSHMAPGSVC